MLFINLFRIQHHEFSVMSVLPSRMMILAAGRGSRLRPLTDRIPKPLIEVAGKPLIVYHLEQAQALGIENVVINVSYLGEAIIHALGDGGRWNLNINYSVETEPLETAGGLVHARPLLGEGAFLLCNADIYHSMDLSLLMGEQPGPTDGLRLVMVPNPPEQPDGNFWQNNAGQLYAESQSGARPLTYSGLGLYTTEFVDSIDQLHSQNPECKRTPYYLKRWMAQGRVRGMLFEGLWSDVGTPERLTALQQLLLQEKPRERQE